MPSHPPQRTSINPARLHGAPVLLHAGPGGFKVATEAGLHDGELCRGTAGAAPEERAEAGVRECSVLGAPKPSQPQLMLGGLRLGGGPAMQRHAQGRGLRAWLAVSAALLLTCFPLPSWRWRQAGSGTG